MIEYETPDGSRGFIPLHRVLAIKPDEQGYRMTTTSLVNPRDTITTALSHWRIVPHNEDFG